MQNTNQIGLKLKMCPNKNKRKTKFIILFVSNVAFVLGNKIKEFVTMLRFCFSLLIKIGLNEWQYWKISTQEVSLLLILWSIIAVFVQSEFAFIFFYTWILQHQWKYWIKFGHLLLKHISFHFLSVFSQYAWSASTFTFTFNICI